jgi:hypothetical protein
MPTKRARNDFINFLLDAEKKPSLTGEFMSIRTAKKLYGFFQEKGYKDIAYNDCQDILTAKKNLAGYTVPEKGQSTRKVCPRRPPLGGPREY